ncbi:hypothetical protein, partial [Streptomyces sp. PT12]|uniref:hypothetical protein n=1 Tax=Streptomyces sp. PT12 TaxID=1510197 RepID=UPI001C666200
PLGESPALAAPVGRLLAAAARTKDHTPAPAAYAAATRWPARTRANATAHRIFPSSRTTAPDPCCHP